MSGNLQVGKWLGEASPRSWSGATSEERAELKAKVARDLSKATGVPEEDCAKFVEQWAYSSNDDDMRSLAIQQDAAKEFGVGLSDFTRGKVGKTEKYTKEIESLRRQGWTEEQIRTTIAWEKSRPLMEPDKQRALLRAMYDKTQTELKTRGITEVKLYRGVKLESKPGNIGDAVGIETNALESWSIGVNVAADFAKKGKVRTIFETVVPAERILSTPATGFGCLTEGEVVVLGGVEGDVANIAFVKEAA